MRSSLTSGLLKTALAVTLTLAGTTAATAQGRNPLRPVQSFATTFGQQANSQAKINALVSRPGNSQDFVNSGSPGTVTWQHQTNSAYTYDTQGRLLQRLYSDPTTNQPVAREIQVYNGQGAEIEMRREQWQGTSWAIVDGFRSQLTYNAGGQLIENISQFWNSSMNNWENESREERTYDANNMVATVTHSDWNNITWEPIERMVLSYSVATGNSALIQEYTGGTWQTLLRATNLMWRVPFEIPSTYLLELNNNGSWIYAEKYNAVYDANGGHVGIYEEWDGMAWVNKYRETESFDANKNYTGWKDETWDPASSGWTLDGEDREILTYSGIDVTQRLFQDSWGSLSGNLVDREKEIYSNFQTFNISGVKALAELAVNVYPNPTHETLSISFPEHKGSFLATVTDLTGKTCLTRTFKAGENAQLNLETLPSGIYLLQLQTESGSTVKRIIKQ